jgi:phosphate-selective porin
MKPHLFHLMLAVVTVCSLANPALAAPDPAAAPTPPPAEPSTASTPEPTPPEAAPTVAQSAAADSDSSSSDKGRKKGNKNKDKGKDKDKQKDGDPANRKDGGRDQSAAKDAVKASALEPVAATDGDWCVSLSNDPGLLYENKENPWFQSFRIGGRFQYQAAYLDGHDMHGRDFHDTYDEYRRLRLETKTKFLQYFTTTLDVNLVADDRFKNPPGNELDWGYDDFDTATLEFNLRKALDTTAFDSLKLVYGKMKMPMTEEQRQSSKEIYTVERSLLADKLGGDESRPTGFAIEWEKAAWRGMVGIFSGEDDADFIGGWNDGVTQFYSVTWQPDGDFHLTLDYASTHQSGSDDALGYGSAVALGSTYDKKRWGAQASLVYGDNGYGDPDDNARNRANRQGDFYGMTVMPWYWLIEDRLQLVCRFQYARAEEAEGLQLSSRYLRGRHDDPLVDVNNGRGSRYNAWYLGLNYYLCGDNAKIMAGVLYENLAASTTVKVDRPRRFGGDYYVPDRGTVAGFTYLIAFRTAF